jgi:hypothetical protein
VPRYQARANVNVSGEVIPVWEVRDLPNTHEVATYVLAGLLVGEDENGNFPDPVVIPIKCCGSLRR